MRVVIVVMSLESWYTEAEAAARLGTTARTVQRYIEQGKIEVQKRPRDGKKPENVCNPRDVAALMPSAHVMPEATPATSNGGTEIAVFPNQQRMPFDTGVLLNFIEALTVALQRQQQPALPAAAAPAETLPPWLTLSEASAQSRLSPSFLREQIRAGKLIAVRGGPHGSRLISRKSLESFEG
jgi:D-alanyl-D-alanine carboxypeptidase